MSKRLALVFAAFALLFSGYFIGKPRPLSWVRNCNNLDELHAIIVAREERQGDGTVAEVSPALVDSEEPMGG